MAICSFFQACRCAWLYVLAKMATEPGEMSLVSGLDMGPRAGWLFVWQVRPGDGPTRLVCWKGAKRYGGVSVKLCTTSSRQLNSKETVKV